MARFQKLFMVPPGTLLIRSKKVTRIWLIFPLRAARGTANVKIPTMGKEAAWSHNDLTPRKPHFSGSLDSAPVLARLLTHFGKPSTGGCMVEA